MTNIALQVARLRNRETVCKNPGLCRGFFMARFMQHAIGSIKKELLEMRKQSGFTLIELMIVVAIIAILAAISVSTYRFYVARSQVTRVMGEAGQLRAAVVDCLNNGRHVIGNAVNECNPAATGSNLLRSNSGNTSPGILLPSGTGVPTLNNLAGPGAVELVATFDNNASAMIAGQTLTWTYDISGSWSCDTTVEMRLRPVGCGN